MTKYDLTYLSLGAGVQSTALLICSAMGLHGVPRADVAIFADTQGEPKFVYDHLEILEKWSPIKIIRVTRGDLMQDTIDRHDGKRSRFAAIPAFTDSAGVATPLRRQCTREYKIEPIQKAVRGMLGLEPGQRAAGRFKVAALIGISLDEIMRASPSRQSWIENVHPLIDARLRRQDCIKIIQEHGLPVPQKSACVFCPYHDNAYWRKLKAEHPEEFQRAVTFDAAIRDMSMSGVKQPVYLHRSLVPLADVEFDGAKGQKELFGEECGGVCAV